MLSTQSAPASPGPDPWRTEHLDLSAQWTEDTNTASWNLFSNNPCPGEVPSLSDPSWWGGMTPSPSDFLNRNRPQTHFRTLYRARLGILVSRIRARKSFGTNTRETILVSRSSPASGPCRPRLCPGLNLWVSFMKSLSRPRITIRYHYDGWRFRNFAKLKCILILSHEHWHYLNKIALHTNSWFDNYLVFVQINWIVFITVQPTW